MNNRFHYKGFEGTAYYDVYREEWYGSVKLLKEAVYYDAASKKDLLDAFINVIESYLDFCTKVKRKPQ